MFFTFYVRKRGTMKYSGLNCEGCGIAFTDEDDVVVCPVCGTPQHRSCWSRENNCVNSQKHSEDYSWVMPDWKKQENTHPAEEKKYSSAEDEIAGKIRFSNDETAIACPHCGALNYSNDAFCMKCHKPLSEKVEQYYEQSGDSWSQIPEQDNPGYQNGPFMNPNAGYENFNRFGGLSPDTVIDDVPITEMAEYIGGNKPGRTIRRFMMMSRGGRAFSLNFPAMIFSPIWYFYKKLPKIGAIILALSLVCTLGATIAGTTDEIKEIYYREGKLAVSMLNGEISQQEYLQQVQEISAEAADVEIAPARRILTTALELIQTMVWIGGGFFADYFYKKKMLKDIAEARESNSNMPDYLEDLRQRGGSSAGMAVLAVVLLLVSKFIESLPVYYYVFSAIGGR